MIVGNDDGHNGKTWAEWERLAYAQGMTEAARLYAAIDDVQVDHEAEIQSMQDERNKALNDLTDAEERIEELEKELDSVEK